MRRKHHENLDNSQLFDALEGRLMMSTAGVTDGLSNTFMVGERQTTCAVVETVDDLTQSEPTSDGNNIWLEVYTCPDDAVNDSRTSDSSMDDLTLSEPTSDGNNIWLEVYTCPDDAVNDSPTKESSINDLTGGQTTQKVALLLPAVQSARS